MTYLLSSALCLLTRTAVTNSYRIIGLSSHALPAVMLYDIEYPVVCHASLCCDLSSLKYPFVENHRNEPLQYCITFCCKPNDAVVSHVQKDSQQYGKSLRKCPKVSNKNTQVPRSRSH